MSKVYCIIPGCGAPVPDGKLTCVDCRDGHFPLVSPKVRRPPGVMEAQVRRAVLTWYRVMGAWAGDFEQGYRPDHCPSCGTHLNHSTRVPKGTPDVYVVVPRGIPLVEGSRWVECKSAKGRQTGEQKEWELRCQEAGILYLLVRSVEDVVDFETRLKENHATDR